MDSIDYKVNFGGVPIGQTASKRFKFKNNSITSTDFVITRCDNSTPTFQVYDFDHYEFELCRKQERSIKVIYQPTCPGQIDIDFFKIIGNDGDSYKLNVHGLCLGPEFECSVKLIEFFKFLNCSQIRKSFKLRNTSTKIPIIYQFDDDCDNGIFLVDQKTGIIQPKQFIMVTVKFVPNQPGCYSKRLSCFILNHEPIYIDLIGFYFKQIYYKDEFVYEHHPSSNVVTSPPFRISESFLDFGRSVVAADDNQVLISELTNNLEIPIEIQWEQSEIFQINPNNVQVQPNDTVGFECKFQPNQNCKLFTRRINGQITWETDDDSIAVPMTTSLTLMGHTFPENHKFFPKIGIQPQIVVLPLTYPTFPSCATFMIKSENPVLFKLIPPENTNFQMKPMLGQIKNYQIIVVQLHTNQTNKAIFMETWNIEINGELLPSLTISIKAQTDIPEICFGTDNFIDFETTQPHCENSCHVPLTNTSNIPLKFKFYDDNGKITIIPNEGYLSKNEEITTICSYYAERDDVEIYEIKYELQAVLNGGLLIGQHEDFVKFTTKCEYSQLYSIPKQFNAGEIAFGSDLKIEFSLYNSGQSTVHFYLYIMDIAENEMIPHRFTPKQSSCEKQQNISIIFQLKATNLGKQLFKIGYKYRLNQYSDQIVEKLEAIELFTVEYSTILPIIQFDQIVEHNLGPLFCKQFLWEFFKIDTLNEVMKTMKNNEKISLQLNAPNFELRDKQFYIVFLIKNLTSIPILIDAKRKKLCNCNYVEISKGISFKQKVLLCPHREILHLDLSRKNIDPNTTALLTMKINYSIPQSTVMSYTIDLDYCRILEIYIQIKPMLPNYLFLSTYSIDNLINFGHVYIGLKQPPIQMIWLYNNSKYQLFYNLDELPITKLNNNEDFQIFECLNSTGVINSYSLYPILFRFCPIETKIYQITTLLEFNREFLQINIEGYGIADNKIMEFNQNKRKQEKCLPTTIPVVLSIEDIIVEPMLTWCSVEKVITIENITKDSYISYYWKPFLIDGIIRIDFVEERGLLKAQESNDIIIRIHSLNEPCNTRIVLNCELLNVTEYRKYEEDFEEVNKKRMLHKDEFVITEKGTFYPTEKDYEKIMLPPEPIFVTITVTVNIIGIQDKDMCLSVDYQMQHINLQELLMNSYEKPDNTIIDLLKKIDKNLLKSIINNLASDVVFSGCFREIMQQLRDQRSSLNDQIGYLLGEDQQQESIIEFKQDKIN